MCSRTDIEPLEKVRVGFLAERMRELQEPASRQEVLEIVIVVALVQTLILFGVDLL